MQWVCAAALLGGAFAHPAVLRIEPAGGKPQFYPALLAEWAADDGRGAGGPLVHEEGNPYGCDRMDQCEGCAVLVLQGNCTFAAKARRAEAAGAQLLIVASQKEGPPVAMAASAKTHAFSAGPPSVMALTVSKATGRKLLLAIDKGVPLAVSCKRYERPYWDLLGEAAIGLVAVSLVVWGAWCSVQDLRQPERRMELDEEVLAVEEKSGVHFVLFGSVMLAVLFFFMKYLIYVLLFVFATGGISTTTALLEPLVAAMLPRLRAQHAYRLPACAGRYFGLLEDHTWSDAVAEGFGIALAVCFLVLRNNDQVGWIFQNIIAVTLLLMIQKTMRLPNLKVGTIMLVCTFFFDIFWVFLSPAIFGKSVMIEVATGGGTGQSVPMVLKIPAISGELPGQFKILGLGDVAIPGLLISLLLRRDITEKIPMHRGYFMAGTIGYALGLLATFISLYLMKHGQPALLFLVPGTLVPTFTIARCRGEVWDFWNANYSPEVTPEGYEALSDPDKQA